MDQVKREVADLRRVAEAAVAESGSCCEWETAAEMAFEATFRPETVLKLIAIAEAALDADLYLRRKMPNAAYGRLATLHILRRANIVPNPASVDR